MGQIGTQSTKHAELQAKKNIDWQTWHRSILGVLEDEGLWKDERELQLSGQHACLACRKRFKTKAAWSVHAFICHGRIAPQRRYANGVLCVICNRVFRYHSALVNHLRYATRCLHELQRPQVHAPLEPSVGSREERRVRENVLAPTLQAYGPLIPALPPGHLRFDQALTPHEEVTVGLLIVLYEEFLQERWDVETFKQRVWGALQQSTVHPADLLDLVRNSLQCYRLQFDRDDVEDFWLDQQFEQLQTALEQAWSMEWLLAEIPTSGTTRISGHGELNVVEEFQKLISAQVTANYVAKPLRVKCIILLHLFSGHRRTGDVQHAFEQLQPTSMFPMMGLSVDVVISLQFGNMLDPRTQRLFLTAVRDGLIGAIVAGPPCESWSQAREQYYREQRGPRPIRTVQSPQGMEQLRLREITQLIVGNDLLGAAMLFAYTAWISGCFMILEHPREPSSTYSPSIWKLPVTLFLLRQPNIRRLVVKQGLYGVEAH